MGGKCSSMRTNIEFSADGIKLCGWLYLPDEGTAPFPTVVMSNGFVLTKGPLARLAQIFGDAGLACVLYDNRCLGASDGEPRQEVDPWLQIRDYRYAITFTQSISQVDSERIGIWGTSYSGGIRDRLRITAKSQ